MKLITLLALGLLFSSSVFSASNDPANGWAAESDSDILPSILRSTSFESLDIMTDADKEQTQGHGLNKLNSILRSQQLRERLHREVAN